MFENRSAARRILSTTLRQLRRGGVRLKITDRIVGSAWVAADGVTVGHV